jgi:nucleoid-associated protein YgaU
MFGRLPFRAVVSAAAIAATVAAFALGAAPPSPAAGADDAGAATGERYVVRPCDTLWAIAERRYPAADPRRSVYRIDQANGGDVGVLVPGDVVVLP